jgi:acyl carrier protein
LVPIGRPIANIEIYILDSYLQAVPIGVAGELHIGGIGLARGYLNQPGLTAEKFISNPYGQAADRLYKTGDLARFLPDGNVEYLGRIDHQVKLRGFRIELGEIEAVLSSHPAVQQAAVTLREDHPGEKYLVAYFALQEGENAAPSELHAFLKERLPEYMLPAKFLKLARLPLSSNGKIDRRALPAPDMVRPETDRTILAARTPLEEEVAAAWKQVLRLERVDVNDNFFEIGGHSLLATRVIILLRTRLGVNLSLRLVFEYPTVSGMASALLQRLLEHSDSSEMKQLVDEVEALSKEEVRTMLATTASEVTSPVQQQLADAHD